MWGALALRRGRLDWSRPYIVGVLNVTPDSFSDGGADPDPDAAVRRGVALWAGGADVIDVGGESTRPGAAAVPADLEIARVVPVIRGLRARVDAPIAVDTTKAQVARAAIAAGADLVNDISGGLFDAAIIDVIADEVARAPGVGYVCGHVRGRDLAAVHAAEAAPPSFDDVADELAARVAALPPAVRAVTIADPCLGFGKQTAQNVELCGRAGDLAERVGRPVLIGPSRKRFVGAITGASDPRDPRRDAGTVGAALAAVAGGAQLVRVHNVEILAPALAVFGAIVKIRGVRLPGS